MKIFKLAATAAMLLGPLAGASANELTTNPLTIESFSVTPGEPSELVMYYNTDEQYIGLQFEITLPEGITFAMDPENETEVDFPVINTKLTRTHDLWADLHADGVYKAVFVSNRNEVIKSGAWLIKIPIVVSEGSSGSGTGSIKGCRYATDKTETEPAREDKYLDPDYFDIYVAPTAISLSNSTLDLKPGETATLTAEYEPATAAHLPLTWTTSDAAVATVDEQGNVTAIAQGNAVITAALADNPAIAATCEVTVNLVPSGLTDTTVEEQTGTMIYDLNGRRINAGTLPRGSIVIVKSPSGTRKVHRP